MSVEVARREGSEGGHVPEDHEENPKGRISALRRKGADTLSSAVNAPTTKKSIDVTKVAAGKVGHTLARGSRFVSQAEAWEETESTVETLIDVVCAQHAMLLELIERVEKLEAGGTTADAVPEA